MRLPCVPKAILANVISKLRRVTKARIIVSEGEAPFLIEEVVRGHLDLLVSNPHHLCNNPKSTSPTYHHWRHRCHPKTLKVRNHPRKICR